MKVMYSNSFNIYYGCVDTQKITKEMSTQETRSWALWKHRGAMVQYSCKNIRKNYKIGKIPKRKKITLYKEENAPKKGTTEKVP